MKQISLDLVRVTEAAAISASKWIGSGDKENADKAATDAMRDRLNAMDFAGKIIIGEGEKDESFGLFTGEWVGSKANIRTIEMVDVVGLEQPDEYYEIAVDPVEGTTPTVTSGPEAISVIALANKGCMNQMNSFYARKLAYGPKIKKKTRLSLNDPIETTVKLAALALDKNISDVVVCILNRPRHDAVIKTLRNMRVRIKLIQDCDVSGAVAACLPDTGVDLLYGIGGGPEAIISACAIKALGGDFQAQEVSKDGSEVQGDHLSLSELISGECIFAATGITNGSLLKGVMSTSRGPVTNSVFMRSESGTIRWLTTYHGN